MKKYSFLFVIFCIPFMASAQDAPENSYAMWETMYITPDYTKLGAFSDAMGKHNKTYHKEGAYAALTYNVVTGPNTGKMIWLMGPCTYKDLDSRPSDGGHDEDWAQNVMPLVKKMHNGEYWRMDADNTTLSPDGEPYNVILVRYHEVYKGQSHRAGPILDKIGATIKSMEGARPWAIFRNEFRQGYKTGRHIASVTYFDNWAQLDEGPSFRQAYEKLHGANSWYAFRTEMEAIFENTWDEIWSYMPEMSGVE